MVVLWLIVNAVLLYGLIILNEFPDQRNLFVLGMSAFFTANVAFRAIFAVLYMLKFNLYNIVDKLEKKKFFKSKSSEKKRN
jgi:hypothetical protein